LTREMRRLLDWRGLLGWLGWALFARPWFALVGSGTKGAYLEGFFLQHNKDPVLAPLEGDSGPGYYHLGSLLGGVFPWSIFLVPALWHALKESKGQGPKSKVEEPALPPVAVKREACRFLLCWIGVYLVFFSISQTKLPNYILPLYPAAALLTAHFLERWRCGA